MPQTYGDLRQVMAGSHQQTRQQGRRGSDVISKSPIQEKQAQHEDEDVQDMNRVGARIHRQRWRAGEVPSRAETDGKEIDCRDKGLI